MALKRHIFDVYLAPLDGDGEPDFAADPIEHLAVQVIQADTIRAELEGNRQKLPPLDKAAMTATTMWVWAALDRTGDVECKWSEFRDRCVAVQPLKDGVVPVDPTQPAPSGTPSSSPPTSAAAPATGSTPPSTTG